MKKQNLKRSLNLEDLDNLSNNDLFNIDNLIEDIGYKPTKTFNEFAIDYFKKMNTAIISGAAGFIGSTLANYLLSQNYRVIALGRKEFSEIKLSRLNPNKNLIYIKIEMKNISNLKNIIDNNYKEFITENSFFYHFAWGGTKVYLI